LHDGNKLTQINWGGGKVWKFAGRAVVEGDLACECEFTAMLDLSGGPQA
jgi:3-hydroxymyristoyl/3-hydroxydecanoyl-(acyl carrier protein) dehydratase